MGVVTRYMKSALYCVLVEPPFGDEGSSLSMERYTNISDSSLDEIIQAFKADQPHCGFSLVQGHLFANAE